MIEDKKIVITGGAGFVGSNLAHKLSGKNEVLLIDNLSNSISDISSISNNLSIGNSADIDKICNNAKFNPDLVFHLGEYSRVETSFEDIDEVLENNRRSFSRVLKFCRLRNAKLIYSGSSTKFSIKTDDYISSPYELSKAENVETLNWYAALTDLPYAAVYFYNVYGENEKANGKYATVVAKFLSQYEQNAPLTVRSPGTQKRNFTHINDIIDGLILVAKNGNGDGFSIGHPEQFSIAELANLISHDQIILPPAKGNRISAEIDLTQIYNLGWKPKHNLENYIEVRKHEINNSKR